MFVVGITLASLWIAWSLIQFALALHFLRLMRVSKTSNPNSEKAIAPQGRAAVLLAVRGMDPSFRTCLTSLLNQDYKDFEIHVVVDSKEDPAWNAIQQVSDLPTADGRLFAHRMTQPLPHCGLKCSALVHGLKQIESKVDYLVLVDSDVVAHSGWLTELLNPLVDPKVGVTTGGQWFEPASIQPSSLIRSLWNAGAIVPTVMFRNPWAGTMAMRMKDFERSGLAEKWRTSIVDDGPVKNAFANLDLDVEFVPSLVMVNQETCSFPFVVRYIQRMLTWSRLHEPTFANTMIHGTLTGILLLSLFAIAIFSLVFLDKTVIGLAMGSLFVGMILNGLGYLIVRHPINQLKARQGNALPSVTLVRLLMLSLLSPVTQLIYFKSVVGASLSKTVKWRNATYQIRGKSDVQLIDYSPFTQKSDSRSII